MDAVQDGCSTGWMQGRTADAVQNRSRKSHMQYMTAAGQVRYITAQMQDRMD